MNSCIIAIEAKSYEGYIKSVGDNRNTNWVCEKGNFQIPINACWGLNPYRQVKTYVDSLLSRPKSSKVVRITKPSVYGVVVFPSKAKIDPGITNNIGGYFRVTTLDELVETIELFEAEAQSKNGSRTSYTNHAQYLTSASEQLAA